MLPLFSEFEAETKIQFPHRVFPADLSGLWNAATSAETFSTRVLCLMQISILRACGSKRRAEVNIKLVWECCTMPAFLQQGTSFSLAEEPCSESRDENPPTLILLEQPWQDCGCCSSSRTLLFTGSLRGRKCPAFRNGSGRFWRKDWVSKPAVMFDTMGTIGQLGWFLAGWGGALDRNTNCAWWQKWSPRAVICLRSSHLSLFFLFSHLAGVVLPRYLCSWQKCLGQQFPMII